MKIAICLIAIGVVCTVCQSANAAVDYCPCPGIKVGQTLVKDSSCTTVPQTCTGTTSSTSGCYTTTTTKKVTSSCNTTSSTTQATVSALCSSDKSVACASSCYGTATSRLGQNSGCNTCPSNATCDGSATFKCNAGYYQNGSSCSQCPSGGTSAAGSTSITQCYLSGSFSDSTGSGTYTSNCYYSN